MRISALMISILCLTLIISLGLVKSSSAQEIAIETSADEFGGSFFGQGVLQVVVTDPDADDDNTVEEISVDITSNPDGASSGSADITVPETNDGSSRFEFFLVHVSAVQVGPEDLDPLNTAGINGDGSCLAGCAPFVTFGPGGDLDVSADIYDAVRFEILVGNTEFIVNYEETLGALRLDRDSYGSTSYVYISIVDQDANLNPTERDEFTVDFDSNPNEDVFTLHGGTFEDVIIFRETGDNTAVFEGRYRLGESILANSESLLLTLHEKANYDSTLATPENNSNNIDEITFTIGNSDGTVQVGVNQQTKPTWDSIVSADSDTYALGDHVYLTITDKDANTNTALAESVSIQITSGSSQIELTAVETGVNTGMFKANFSFAEETNFESNSIVPGASATIIYTDKQPADYFEKVQAGVNPEKDFILEIDIQLPVKAGIDATGVAAPAVTSLTGDSEGLAVGTSLMLSTSIVNNNEQVQAFMAIIEVRDSEGVTVYLALQGGTLEPRGSSDISILWQPDHSGLYEVRMFAVTDVGAQVEALSPVASSKINIS